MDDSGFQFEGLRQSMRHEEKASRKKVVGGLGARQQEPGMQSSTFV
jgi:hypothetical protein